MDVPTIARTAGEAPRAGGARASDRPIARWAVAVIAVVYGLAKLNGAQFTVLESELDKPMGSVSGFWLTWYYLSYSPAYGNLIAVLQVVGGLLVTQPRSAIAGALLLLPIATNIVLIDIFHGINFGGTLTALLFLGLLVRIVLPYAHRLVDAVIPSSGGRRGAWRTFVAPGALVIAAFGFTYWVANYNNRAPTAVDGVWLVESVGGAQALERVFFERNRAHMVVLKDTSGSYSRHHFELDSDGRLRIWHEWLRKGPLLFDGAFVPPDNIRLRRAGVAGDEVVELRRVAP